MYLGIVQAVSNLTYMALAIVGKNYILMCSAIFIENLCAGMGTAALLALLMALCNHRYTATQFALLSALSAVGRVFMGPIAGVMVVHLGWATFFFWSTIIGIPGLLLLWWLRGLLDLKLSMQTELVN